MTTVMSPTSSPSPSSHRTRGASPHVSQPALPPLNTNAPPRRTTLQRPPSFARNRMSSYSTTSNPPNHRSRPSTQVFPTFHSSLSYALVRDFAYPIIHPHHYGPPPEPSGHQSGTSTPLSELQRTLSEPSSSTSWASAAQWPGAQWDANRSSHVGQLPPRAYGDGPPYSEDEDLHSPVVTSSRHKKSRSSQAAMHTGHERRSPKDRDGGDLRYGAMDHYFADTNGKYDDNEAYHKEQRSSNNLTSNPQSRKSRQRDSHFAAVLPDRAYTREAEDDSDPSLSEDEGDIEPSEYVDDSRFSRDYQFTIASLDEEMHGKAVALFDFTRENENELPLVEGQVILVSYRQQQGWLVAEDPRTGESGLVPEEYVRLLRDIEGGYASLSGMSAEDIDEQNRVGEGEQQEESSPEEAPSHSQGQQNPMSPTETQDPTSPASTSSPTITTNGASSTSSTNHPPHHHHHSSSSTTNTTSSSTTSTSTSDRRPAAVSSFSTSSSDLNPFPSHLLTGSKNSETPPPVTHYGSQANTPTVGSPPGGGLGLGKWDGRKDSGNGGGEGDGGEGREGGEGVVTLGKGAFGQGSEGRRSG